MAAFAFCVEQDVKWVELDIRLTRDAVPVVIHDDHILRSGGGRYPIRENNYEDLRIFDIGGGEYLPRFKDVLEKFSSRLFFDIEIKELDAVEQVINLIHEFEINDSVFISSFIPDVLQEAKQISPEIDRGLLIDRIAGRLTGAKSSVNAAKLLECKYFLPHFHRVSSEWIRAAHQENIRLITWTVNKEEDISQMLEYKVDGLITDCPVDIKSMLRKLNLI